MASKADGTIIINTKIDTDGIKEGVEETKKALDIGDVIKGSAIGSAVAGLVEDIVSNVKEIGQAFIESAATVKEASSHKHLKKCRAQRIRQSVELLMILGFWKPD